MSKEWMGFISGDESNIITVSPEKTEESDGSRATLSRGQSLIDDGITSLSPPPRRRQLEREDAESMSELKPPSRKNSTDEGLQSMKVTPRRSNRKTLRPQTDSVEQSNSSITKSSNSKVSERKIPVVEIGVGTIAEQKVPESSAHDDNGSISSSSTALAKAVEEVWLSDRRPRTFDETVDDIPGDEKILVQDESVIDDIPVDDKILVEEFDGRRRGKRGISLYVKRYFLFSVIFCFVIIGVVVAASIGSFSNSSNNNKDSATPAPVESFQPSLAPDPVKVSPASSSSQFEATETLFPSPAPIPKPPPSWLRI